MGAQVLTRGTLKEYWFFSYFPRIHNLGFLWPRMVYQSFLDIYYVRGILAEVSLPSVQSFFSSTSFLCLQLLSICYCYSFITRKLLLTVIFNLRIWLKCPNCNFHPFCDVKWVVTQHVSRALSNTPRTVTVEKRWAISPEKNWRRRGKTILPLLKPTLIFHHEKQFKNIILFLKHTRWNQFI